MSLRSLAGKLADTLADGGWRAKARPSQLPPPGDWNGWLVMAGRGWGKNETASQWLHETVQANDAGRIALVAPTAADARDTIIEGTSGILATAPAWCRPTYEPSKRKLTWPNGAIAHTFSSEEADRLRGPQFDLAFADEVAAWNEPQATWDMLMFGLRLGKHPRWLVTTTPRPIKLLKDLLAREGGDVVVTRGSTYENAANLAGPFLDAIRAKYEGTRLGRQELNADLLEDTPGALWQRSWIDRDRVAEAPELKRIVVAIDPAVSTNDGSDETGIVVAGLDAKGHAYVLEDISGKFGPDEWARRAVSAYHHWSADRIVAEKNQGGDMVENVIRSVEKNVPFRAVHASRGKVTRAEPVSALYEQGKVHHVGEHSILEDQLCGFTSDFDRSRAGFSPDRLDALVWALTELIVKHVEAGRTIITTWGAPAPGDGITSKPKSSFPDGLITDPADPCFGGMATSIFRF
jgi:predicted phage terminase large subunit-like protein